MNSSIPHRPASPSFRRNESGTLPPASGPDGMTFRDWIASQVMVVLATKRMGAPSPEGDAFIAACSYQLADEMERARN